MVNQIVRFYRQCDPAEPLLSGDPRYVRCDDVRGQGDPIGQIANAIRWSDEPQHILFTGHRGGGKSTELLRLKGALENPPPGDEKFFVVYVEADSEDIDVNDADFPDVLLAMIRTTATALREMAGVDLHPDLARRVGQSLTGLPGVVDVEIVGPDAYFSSVTASIKSSPDARKRIRDALEPVVSDIIEETNNQLEDACDQLRKKGYRDLVLIVDNLDRIVLRQLSSGFTTHDQLFINRGAQLRAIGAHVVYTVPISLVFTPGAIGLTNTFGRRPEVLPMIKVMERDGQDSANGIAKMGDMVRSRLKGSNAVEATAFDSRQTIEYLCRMSGGHVRNLMVLLRSAMAQLDDFPITQTAADRAVQGMINDFDRALNNPEMFDVLARTKQTNELAGTEHDQLLLYNLSILEYLDSDDSAWYAVNPAVRL